MGLYYGRAVAMRFEVVKLNNAECWGGGEELQENLDFRPSENI